MASLVINSRRIILSYHRGLKILVRSSRAFSHQGPGKATSIFPEGSLDAVKSVKEPLYQWMDIKRGILGPEDDRLPLPGNTGLAPQLDSEFRALEELIEELKMSVEERVKTFDLHDDNMALVNSRDDDPMIELQVKRYLDTPDQTQLECTIQQCSKLLISDFKALFPDLIRKYPDGKEPKMVALTICQRTHNEMGAWSAKMEEERDLLTKQFIELSSRIRHEFNQKGYWCNFVDPSSGRPYHGPYTTDTLFETDDRYRRLGFRIEDSGCCKIISHKKWGSKIFVGTIFTTADLCHSEKLLEFLMNLCPIKDPGDR